MGPPTLIPRLYGPWGVVPPPSIRQGLRYSQDSQLAGMRQEVGTPPRRQTDTWMGRRDPHRTPVPPTPRPKAETRDGTLGPTRGDATGRGKTQHGPPRVIGWDHRPLTRRGDRTPGPPTLAHDRDSGRGQRDTDEEGGQDAGSPPCGRGRRLRTGTPGPGDRDPPPLAAGCSPCPCRPGPRLTISGLRSVLSRTPPRGTAAGSSGRCARRTPGPAPGH